MINPSSLPYVNKWVDYNISALNKSINSMKEYSHDIKMFLEYLKASNIEQVNVIKDSDIYGYLTYLTTVKKSKSATRAKKISAFKSYFSYLYKIAKVISIDPSVDIPTPKIEKRLPVNLNIVESKLLLKTVKEYSKHKLRDIAMITLFLNCGLRLSELVDLNVDNIDLSEKKMSIIGKGNKERTVYLNDVCISVLVKYLVALKITSGAVFITDKRKRISKRNVQALVKRFILKAGLDVNKYSVHKLRHTAATLMFQHGKVDIRTLQELLGHEQLSTTQIYAEVSPEQVQNAVNKNPLNRKKYS